MKIFKSLLCPLTLKLWLRYKPTHLRSFTGDPHQRFVFWYLFRSLIPISIYLIFFYSIQIIFCNIACAANETNLSTENNNSQGWLFTGIVKNENDESFSYYFQIQKVGDNLLSLAALFNNQSKERLLFEQGHAKIEAKNTTLLVGRAFLNFNPISNSWIFGMQPNSYPHFNFKVDTLTQNKITDNILENNLIAQRVGPLNGHLQITKETPEQFVRAKYTWFKQDLQQNMQQKATILCQFDDGQSFSALQSYTTNIPGPSAVWYDKNNLNLPISQFINFFPSKDSWRVKITIPKINLELKNILIDKIMAQSKEKLTDLMDNEAPVIAGFTSPKAGFCAINNQKSIKYS